MATTVLSNVRVLIPTTFVLDENLVRALLAGAGGLLGKDAESDELLAGIRTVAADEALLSPGRPPDALRLIPLRARPWCGGPGARS